MFRRLAVARRHSTHDYYAGRFYRGDGMTESEKVVVERPEKTRTIVNTSLSIVRSYRKQTKKRNNRFGRDFYILHSERGDRCICFSVSRFFFFLFSVVVFRRSVNDFFARTVAPVCRAKFGSIVGAFRFFGFFAVATQSVNQQRVPDADAFFKTSRRFSSQFFRPNKSTRTVKFA